MSTMTSHPEEQVAAWFMQRKGYHGVAPRSIEQLRDQPCWYFTYDLPGEGILELEVSWDARRNEWDTTVTTFKVAD